MRQLLGFDQIVDQSVRYGVAADCHLAVNCSLAVFRTLVVPHAARCEKLICMSHSIKLLDTQGAPQELQQGHSSHPGPGSQFQPGNLLYLLHINFALSTDHFNFWTSESQGLTGLLQLGGFH